MNTKSNMKSLKIMVYLMGYTMVFGMFFICYVLYQQNKDMSKGKEVIMQDNKCAHLETLAKFDLDGSTIVINRIKK